MSMAYIRDAYGVPAKRGARVTYCEGYGAPSGFKRRPGVIVGSRGQYLRVRLDGERRAVTLHPTWQIDY